MTDTTTPGDVVAAVLPAATSCTCADFIFRGNAEPGYECKHVAAVLKFIGRQYLKFEYDPRRQMSRVA